MPVGILTRHLGKTWAAQAALSDVSLRFEPGLIHGLIGPDAAGKTTLIRIMAGLLYPSSGSVEYFSQKGPLSFSDIRPALAYMPQQQSLYPDLSVREHLEFFGDLYQLPEAVFQARSQELLRVTRLENFQERRARVLSGGMYKKLGLMCALLQSPKVVLLDEPTNGVDPISRREFWDLLYHLAADQITVLVSTAYMDEAQRCSRVHVLDQGRVLVSGEPREILKSSGKESFEELFLSARSSS